MSSQSKLKIVSQLSPDFNSNVVLDNIRYHVQTEYLGRKHPKIVSKIFLAGEVVFSKKSDYTPSGKLTDPSDHLNGAMERQHKATIDDFLYERSRKERPKSLYLEECILLLRRKNGKSALIIIRNALEKFPDDPLFLSYYGYLVASIENNPAKGISTCREAITRLKNSEFTEYKQLYPLFYLNLGRAYLHAKNRSEALNIFNEGLKSNPKDRDLLWELKKLGTRKQPVIPFLKRNNPLNKYLGKLRNRLSR